MLVLIAASLFWLHVAWLAHLQGPYCVDDAYISFRYARNLANGAGLVFNPGEYVEGYTNFGWVLGVAVIEACGLDPVVVTRVLNACMGTAILIVSLVFLRRRATHPRTAVPITAALLVADGSLARWSQDGMETIAFSLAVLIGALLSFRRGRPWFALLLGGAALIRPEAVLCFALLLALRLWRVDPRNRGRELASAIALFALWLLPWLAWKWFYYGSVLPNTFHAKVGYTEAQVLRGIRYVARYWIGQRVFLLSAILAAAILVARRSGSVRLARWWTPLAIVVAAYTAYVTGVGGDWMGSGRFLVPMTAPAALLAGELLAVALRGASLRAAGALAVALAFALLLGTSIRAEQRDIRAERPRLESRDQVAHWLADHAQPEDTLLSDETGQLSYVSGLATDDLLGLTDPRIARLEVSDMGSGKAGHEKMDLAYSLAKKPTWIFRPSLAAQLPELRRDYPAFADYEPVRFGAEVPLDFYRLILHRSPDAP